MQTLYLTRRNLLTLLSKLDRVKEGGKSYCTIIKQDTVHPKYPCSDAITVTAIEDADYYDEERSAGIVHPEDEARIGKGLSHSILNNSLGSRRLMATTS